MACRIVGWVGFAALFACAAAQGQSSGHGVHPPMPGTRLYVTLQNPQSTPPSNQDVPLELRSSSSPETLQQKIEAPGFPAGLRAVRYVPASQLEQRGQAVEKGGVCAIELAIEGPTQSFRRWLLADDPERNRLMSYIGTWRYMAVGDEASREALFGQFETEFTRAPTLRIGSLSDSTWREISAEVGKEHRDVESGFMVTVKQFFPDYAIDQTTLSPTNQSSRRRNPAVQVEIKRGEKVEDRWVFSKFPEFSHAGGERLPLRVILECAMETEGATPDFAVVTAGKATHEVWTRAAGRVTRAALSKDQVVSVPGSAYGFRMTEFIGDGRIVESYRPADNGKGRPAVEFEIAGGEGDSKKLWLELGQTRRVETAGGAVFVGLQDHPTAGAKGHP